MSKITDVRTVDNMISFLKEKGTNHESYYHYTSWDSLTKIFQNKTFLLTRGNSLNINDQHEALMKGSKEEWDKIFIGSFAFGSSEIMAMWGLYGLPWSDAVRIAIPKEKMNQWVNGIEEIKLFKNGNTVDFQDNFDVGLNDIVYIGGKKGSNTQQLTHYGKSITISDTFPLYGIDTTDEMTGYIKNYSWQYENEVRLRIRLARPTDYEKISIVIPDDIINSITVTTGPCFKEREDPLYTQLIKENRVDESGFKGLVRYKELCDLCEHEHFLRKE